MIENKEMLKPKRWYINLLEAFDDFCYNHMGHMDGINQFTIDYVQELLDEMQAENNFYPQLDPDNIDDDCVKYPNPDIIGSIHYKIMNIMEIMDEALPDYDVFKKLDNMFSENKYLNEKEKTMWHNLMDIYFRNYDTSCEWLSKLE